VVACVFLNYVFISIIPQLPSVHGHCWLGIRKGIWPVKILVQTFRGTTS